MTGVAGNSWTEKIGKQSAKGTPQTTPTHAFNFTGGGGPMPRTDTITLAETDANRQQGSIVKVGFGVEGAAEHYLRLSQFHMLADALLGSTVTTGATNFTHTSSSTAAGTTGYFTIYKALGTALCDRYVDCQLAQLQVAGGAGQALTAQATWMGLSFTLNETMPGSPAAPTDTPMVYPLVTVTKGGSATAQVSAFSITISQGRTIVQGDTGFSAADIAPGLIAVTGELTILFENDDDYNNFYGGAAAATTPTTTVVSEALNITALETANRSVAFDMDGVTLTSYAPPLNTDGSPIEVTATFVALRQATLAGLLEIVVKNQSATVAA